ncbi:DUF3253 domain-containing protein [Luteibacter sp. 9135]|uniref:DUF3253 domain-containing protein n=1 Tax=Luteibacter sp. 9135 TaxID=1500893 RepID=UPI003F88C63E
MADLCLVDFPNMPRFVWTPGGRIATTSSSPLCIYCDAMDIAASIMDMLSRRSSEASICPSDVARALADDETTWRALMPSVREVAAELARHGVIIVTQGKSTLDPADIAHGPIRLRRGERFPGR